MDKIESALYDLEQTSIRDFRSDPERDDAMRREYERIILVLADEVQELKRRLSENGTAQDKRR